MRPPMLAGAGAGASASAAVAVVAMTAATAEFGPHGGVLAGLVGTVAAAARRGVRRARGRARDEQTRTASEDLLAAFADELDAGHPPAQALRTAVAGVLADHRRRGTDWAAPASAASGAARKQDHGQSVDVDLDLGGLDLGDDVAAALRLPVALDQVPALLAAGREPADVLRACDAPALRQLGVGWQVSHRTGIRLAPVASKLAATVRADADRRRELRAALAGARSSARLLASLPLAGMLLGALVGARPHEVLLTTTPGLACLVAGVALDLVGLGWTNRIADSAVASRAEPFPPRDRPVRHPPGHRPGRPSRESRPAPGPPSAAGRALAIAGAAAVAGTVALAPRFAVAVGCATVTLAAGWLFVGLRRAAAEDPAARLIADLPAALDLAAACLAAGTAPDVAQRAVGYAVGGPLGPALLAAARRTGMGAPAGEAFTDLVAAGRPPRFSRPPRFNGLGRDRAGPATQAVNAVARAFERSGDSGAKVAATLERVADRLRASAHADTAEAVRRAGVLAVLPLGFCFLPAFGLLGVVPVVLATADGLLGKLVAAAGVS